MATSYNEGNYIDDLVKQEADGKFSRDVVTLTGSAALKMGTVLGKILTAGASVVAAGGNTGNGVLTVDVTDPVLAGDVDGDYAVKCIAAATNGGTFEVFAPTGESLGTVLVGATFANRIKFAIADGSTDFAVGDLFTVTAAAGTGKFMQLTPAATTGAEIAAAVLLYDADATDADVEAVVISRHAVLIADNLIFPDGISDAAKALALENLTALGILTNRAEA